MLKSFCVILKGLKTSELLLSNDFNIYFMYNESLTSYEIILKTKIYILLLFQNTLNCYKSSLTGIVH